MKQFFTMMVIFIIVGTQNTYGKWTPTTGSSGNSGRGGDGCVTRPTVSRPTTTRCPQPSYRQSSHCSRPTVSHQSYRNDNHCSQPRYSGHSSYREPSRCYSQPRYSGYYNRGYYPSYRYSTPVYGYPIVQPYIVPVVPMAPIVLGGGYYGSGGGFSINLGFGY